MSAVVTIESVEAMVNQLPPAERLRLARKLLAEAKRLEKQSLPEVTWESVRGIAPNLMNGEDAQEWVSRTRREGQ